MDQLENLSYMKEDNNNNKRGDYMKNIEQLIYTYKHRKIVEFMAKKYFNNKELIKQIKQHDLDKMYLLLFYNKKDIKSFHTKLSTHHDNELKKTKLDYMEMVLDWESARYTKEDKPLNAYDTLYKFYPKLEKNILPILKEIHLDKSTTEKEKDILDYTKSLSNITENDIKKELIDYIIEL